MQPNHKSDAALLTGYVAGMALGFLGTAGARSGQVLVFSAGALTRIFLTQELDDFRA